MNLFKCAANLARFVAYASRKVMRGWFKKKRNQQFVKTICNNNLFGLLDILSGSKTNKFAYPTPILKPWAEEESSIILLQLSWLTDVLNLFFYMNIISSSK